MVLPCADSLFHRSQKGARNRDTKSWGRTAYYHPAAEYLEDRVTPAALSLYDGQDFLGNIAVFNPANPADLSGTVNVAERTWLVIHGRESERGSEDMLSLTRALSQARPNDQVLTLDWSERASGALSFDQDRWILPVAQAAASALQARGMSGANLNIIGHSWGAYIGAEIAERLPGQTVHSILAIDPGRDGLAAYNPEAGNEINFARNSGSSWAFFESGGDPLGSRITPTTADEQFVIRDSGHGDVTEVFASMLRLPMDNPIHEAFDLDRLVNDETGPWSVNSYDSSGDQQSGSPYDAVLEADQTARNIFRVRYLAAGGEVSLLNGQESVFHGLRFETTGQFATGPVRVGLAPADGQTFTPLVLFQNGVTFNDVARSFTGHGVYGILAGHSFAVDPNGAWTVPVDDWIDAHGNLDLSLATASFHLGGVGLEATNLRLQYTPSDVLSLSGQAELSFGDNSLTIALGNETTPGVVIEDGELEGFHASVSATPFSIGGVTITPQTLTVDYTASSNRYAVTGGATLEVAGSTIGVDFGGEETDGLVLENGQLQSLNMSVEADFDLKGLRFGAHDLTIDYNRAASRFAMYGSLFVSTGGDSPTLNRLTATLGDASNPGLVLVGGDLQSLNIGVSGSFSLFGVTLTAENLTVQYVSSSGIVQLQGGVTVQLSDHIRGSVSLPNGGITINTQTGAVRVNGLRLEFDVQLGAFRIDDLFVEYTDNRPTGGGVTIAAGGEVTLPGGFTVGGEFSITNGHVTYVSLQYDAGSSAGIALGDTGLYLTHLGGSLQNLDNLSQITVTATAEVTFAKSVSFMGYTGKLFVASGSLTVSPQQLTIHGEVALIAIKNDGDTAYHGLLGEGSVDVTLDWTRGSYRADVHNIPVWGIFSLSGGFTFTNSGDFTIHAEVGLVVPSVIPVIGGMTLAGAGFYFQVRPNTATLTDDYAAAWVDLGFLGQYGFKIDFTGDVSFLDSQDIERLGGNSPTAPTGQYIYSFSFNVPANVTLARFQVKSDALRDTHFLTTSGQMIGVTDAPGFLTYLISQEGSHDIIIPPGQFNVPLLARYHDGPDSWVLLLGRADGSVIVPSGVYTVYVTSMTPLTEAAAPQVTPFFQYRKPTISITNVELEDTGDLSIHMAPASYGVGSLPTAQTPSKATIRLYYDDTPDGSAQNRAGYDGALIATLPYATRSGSATVITNSYVWHDLLSVAPRPYQSAPDFLYAVIDDGVNEPAFSTYSAAVIPPEPVTITAPSVQSYNGATPLAFSAANGNAIAITQQGFKTPIRMVIEASQGNLRLRGSTAVSSSLVLNGTREDLTSILDGLTYLPHAGATTLATLTVRGIAITPKEFFSETQITLVPAHADIAVSLQAPPGPVAEGGAVDILATITNQEAAGDQNASGVRAILPLPAGLSLVSMTTTSGSYDPTTGIWNIGELPLGHAASLVLTARADAGTDGQTLLIGATAHSDSLDLSTADNTVAVDLEISGQATLAPADIILSKASVAENSPAGTLVAYLSSVDEPGDTHTYQLLNNPDNLFVIQGDELHVAGGANLDHETRPGVPIVVRSTDPNGLSCDRSFLISIVDVNEAPFFLAAPSRTVAEGEKLAFQMVAVDIDGPQDALTYELLTKFEDGPKLSPSGMFHWTPTEIHGGNTFLVCVRATDAGGLSATQTFTIAVEEVNSPPVLEAIPQLIVNEGDVALFTAKAVDADIPAGPLTYSVTSAPLGAQIGARTGQFTWLVADNGFYTGKVQATDSGEPNQSAQTGFLIQVNNIAPRAAVEGPGDGVRGQPLLFTLRATDVSAVDQAAGFGYEIDWGDGKRQIIKRTAGNGAGLAVEHIYAYPGAFGIRVSAWDKDGAGSKTASQSIRINATQLQGNTLVIGGTPANDKILVTPNGPNRITVHVGNQASTVSGARRIVVYGQDGDDNINIARGISIPTELYGDAGSDRLQGGNGPNILVGGAGHDFLLGGSNRDILVGGSGADLLLGQGGNDLLIAGDFLAGETASAQQKGLATLADPWIGATKPAQAIKLLWNFVADRVTHDDPLDILDGGAGQNWLVPNQIDGVKGRFLGS